MGTEDRNGEKDTRFVIGLVADPGLAAEVVDSVGKELPGKLADRWGDSSLSDRWRVETSTQLLPLDEEGVLPLLEIGRSQSEQLGWDLTLILTELPRRAGKRPVLADCRPDERVGLVCLPALGGFRVRHRALDAIVALITDHLWSEETAEQQAERGVRRGAGVPYELVTDTEEERADEEEGSGENRVSVRGGGDAGTAVHLVLTGMRGRARLLIGMVRANRPWRLVPSLSPALAGAAAGAAFGVFYSNIWQLADAFSPGRLALVNAVAVLANMGWLIFDNNLWEAPRDRRLREEAALSNAVTALTVSFGVLCMYAVLYAAVLLAAFVAIPMDYLTTTLKHPAGVSDLATIAWLAASMGILAGALGSGLAGEEAVRRAAYSARERERQKQRRAEEERSGREATRAEKDES